MKQTRTNHRIIARLWTLGLVGVGLLAAPVQAEVVTDFVTATNEAATSPFAGNVVISGGLTVGNTSTISNLFATGGVGINTNNTSGKSLVVAGDTEVAGNLHAISLDLDTPASQGMQVVRYQDMTNYVGGVIAAALGSSISTDSTATATSFGMQASGMIATLDGSLSNNASLSAAAVSGTSQTMSPLGGSTAVRLVQTDGSAWVEVDNGTATLWQTTSSLTAGLVAYYPLDGDATDASGNGYDGTPDGNILSAVGIAGQCYDFDGDSAVITCPAIGSWFPADGSITICAWVNTCAYNSDYTTIAALDTGVGIATRAALKMTSSGTPYYFARSDCGNDESLYATNGPIATNEWHFIVGVQSDIVARIYIDGVLRGEATNCQTLLPDWGNPAMIGRHNDWWGQPESTFHGLIDEVRFYDRMLSAAEVASLYQLIVTTNNYVTYPLARMVDLIAITNNQPNVILGANTTCAGSLTVSNGLTVFGSVTGITAEQVNADQAGAAATVQINLNNATNAIWQALLHIGPYGDISMGTFQ